MNRSLRNLLLLATLALCGDRAGATVKLPAIFSEHAVLLKAADVPVWGTAAPGEAVSVALGNATAATTAGTDGRWQVKLDLSGFDATPRELVVKGTNSVRVADVVVGEVWLASGQSNMEWVVYNTAEAKAAIAASRNPALRVFTVKKKASPVPLADCEGQWQLADPATTGSFTAVGYFFAASVQKYTQQPIGLLHASWGGTPIEAWTSTEALVANPALAEPSRRMQAAAAVFPEQVAAFARDYQTWAGKLGRADERRFEAKTVGGEAGATWRPVEFPNEFAAVGLPDAGTVWLRRKVDVPEAVTGISQGLDIGDPAGFYEVYWNGEKVAESNAQTGHRRPGTIYLRSEAIRAGASELLIRVFNPFGRGALKSDAQAPLRFAGQTFAGPWDVLVERELPPLTAEQRARIPAWPEQPIAGSLTAAFLFNGMIQPLIPYAIRGAIWYQGESNAGRGVQYATSFPLMITDWRTRWARGDFAFYWCQLANFGAKTTAADSPSGWADIREAQTFTQRLPKTGQAVLIEQGEELDVHPRAKREMGARLARLALARVYGRDLVDSGPTLAGAAIERGTIRLRFKNTAGGLVAQPLPATYRPRSTTPTVKPLPINSPGSDLQGFVICGADRKWVWAQARIEGDTVVVSSPEVPAPVAVRYAWAMNPTCNLANGAGLPAGPFRTDKFPLPTQDAKF